MNNSSLHDEKTFYGQFIDDLSNCEREVIIAQDFVKFVKPLSVHIIVHFNVRGGISTVPIIIGKRKNNSSSR